MSSNTTHDYHLVDVGNTYFIFMAHCSVEVVVRLQSNEHEMKVMAEMDSVLCCMCVIYSSLMGISRQFDNDGVTSPYKKGKIW